MRSPLLSPLQTRRAPPERRSNPYILPIILVGAGFLLAQMFWLRENKFLFTPFSIELIRCDECGGTGLATNPENDRGFVLCPSCFGVGSHYVRRIDEDDKLCPACFGMGRVSETETDWRTCQRCQGRGLIRETPWATTGKELPSFMTNQAPVQAAPTGP